MQTQAAEQDCRSGCPFTMRSVHGRRARPNCPILVMYVPNPEHFALNMIAAYSNPGQFGN